MSPSPEALVLLLDAAVTDDAEMARYLIRRFPAMAKKGATLSPDEIAQVAHVDAMTNHFYTYVSDDKMAFGLAIDDRPTARAIVDECNLNDYIYWGANGDPVSVATLADIVECLQASDEHKTPVKVISFLNGVSAGLAASEDPVKAPSSNPAKRARV
jgi:hypothetical protein